MVVGERGDRHMMVPFLIVYIVWILRMVGLL